MAGQAVNVQDDFAGSAALLNSRTLPVQTGAETTLTWVAPVDVDSNWSLAGDGTALVTLVN